MTLNEALHVAREPNQYTQESHRQALRRLATIVEYVQRVVATEDHGHDTDK